MADATQMPSVLPFGKYLLDAEIARGGMARVFRARLRGLGGFEKVLVVKQILPELASDPRFIDMFVREANTLVQMNHPNIVPVYELGIIDSVYFLAMEYVEGATLSDLIAYKGTLAPELIAHIGAQICDALHYAHEKFGVVHRDVTPRNIIIDATGHARLLDFGIAAPTDGSATEEIFGSHGYMPKEQIKGETLTSASDVFALGASLYEAFTGKPAFRGETPIASQTAVLMDEGPFFATVPAVPKDLREVLDRTLAREPEARPHVTQELGRRLRTWLAAAHPEGVGEELGKLAEQARNQPAKKVVPVQGSATASTHDAKHVVRTLATNRALDDLLSKEHPPVGTERMASRAPSDEARAQESAHDTRNSRAPRSAPRAGVYAVASLAVLALVTFLAMKPRWFGMQAPPPRARNAPVAITPTKVAPVVPTQPLIVHEDAGTASRTPDETTPAAAPAYLNVNALPWAALRLDGRVVGTTPRRQLNVSAGNHVLEFSCPPLGRQVRVPVRAVSGRTLSIIANLNVDPPSVNVH